MAVQPSDHESVWGQRFLKIAGEAEIGGHRYYVHLGELGTQGDTRTITIGASSAELTRDQARRLAEVLLHYADHGRLPAPEKP